MPNPSEDMTGAAAPQPAGAPDAARDTSPDIPALLKRYGITTVPRPSYEWGGYRYTNAHDAIAAAKRGASA
jgi:hypothetical protein